MSQNERILLAYLCIMLLAGGLILWVNLATRRPAHRRTARS